MKISLILVRERGQLDTLTGERVTCRTLVTALSDSATPSQLLSLLPSGFCLLTASRALPPLDYSFDLRFYLASSSLQFPVGETRLLHLCWSPDLVTKPAVCATSS